MYNPGKEATKKCINNRNYVVNPKHRMSRPTTDCTVWIVSEDIEMDLFDKSTIENYLCSLNFFWWANDKDTPLGRAVEHNAYIAKYVSDNNQEWHGYPVTCKRNSDIPADTILKKWKDKNIITKKDFTNILQGRGYV